MILWALALLLLQVSPELRQHVEAGLKAKAGGDLDTAIREFQRVAELAPGLAASHVNLGAVYYEKKDYAQAIPPLKKALELNPDLPGAQGMLGAALLAQGYAAEAIPHLEKGQLEHLLGVALLEAGRPRDAVDRLETALQKSPGDEDLLYYLSQAHARLSRQLFDKMRSEKPSSPRTQQMIGEAMAAAGNRVEAEKHLHSALDVRPDLRGVHFALGELHLESGDYEKAETEFRAEVALTPASAAAAYKLGLVLLRRGQTTEALSHLKRADQLMPGMPETQLELGKALLASGDDAGAEAAFRKVLEVESTSQLAQAAHFQLAQIYRKQGRAADADRHLKLFQQLRGKAK